MESGWFWPSLQCTCMDLGGRKLVDYRALSIVLMHAELLCTELALPVTGWFPEYFLQRISHNESRVIGENPKESFAERLRAGDFRLAGYPLANACIE